MSADYRLFDSVPIGIVVCAEDLSVRFWNAGMEYWTDIGRASIVGRSLSAFFPRFASESYRARLALLKDGGPPVVFSYQINGCLFPHPDTKRMERVQHVTATSFAEDGERLLLLAVEDRTEVSARIRAARAEVVRRTEAEDALRRTAEEKERLMKELNHRVKNNLNMISALIRMQRDSIDDQKLRSALDDFDGRIKSFAALHESLHKRESAETVLIGEYLGAVVRDLSDAVETEGKRTAIVLAAPPLELSSRKALYLGLIVAEALTNAFKYGKPAAAEGKVDIRIEAAGEQAELAVADNGPGFPAGFAPERSGSLGLGLIELLAEELGGECRFESGAGVRIVVAFSTGNV